MCGIAGELRLGEPTPAPILAEMAKAIAHRGPDGEATRLISSGALHCSLAHRRLKIIDLAERAAQPMRGPGGTSWIVYNGEIYNYVELRHELATAGARFATTSDTEVLIAAWEAWGPDMLARLNGMFAFAIWDEKKRALFLARDRFGEKPLFFRATPRAFTFGSEIKALRPAIGRLEIDESYLYRFLQFGQLENQRASMVRGVERLPPGHSMEVAERNGSLETTIRRWYELPPAGAGANGHFSPAEQIERYRALFDDAVRIRLRSDVPVGSSLSGGVDSSAVVATLGEIARDDSRHAFHCRMTDDPRLDEGRFAASVASKAHAILDEVAPRAEDLACDFDRLCATQEEPFSAASIYAQWRVFQLAHDRGVTVLLDGQGADEVLAGYPWYAGVAAAERVARLRFGEARALLDAGPSNARPQMMRTAIRDAIRGRTPRALRRLIETMRVPAGLASSVIVSAPARETFGVPPRPAIDRPARGWLDAVLRASTTDGPLQSLLRFADRNSMAFGREVRLPFLDHRLVELSFSLGEEWKIGAGTTKRILRDAMRSRVPAEILDRRDKLGFEAPDGAWFTGPLKGWFVERATAATKRFAGLVDAGRATAAITSIERGDADARALVPVLFPIVSAEACVRSLEGLPS